MASGWCKTIAMQIITTTDQLADLCGRLNASDFVTVDTEFMRESTYWSKLCLVQIAGTDDEAIIDPLADGIDLAPMYDLFANQSVLKVFHAARQDIEIFHNQSGAIPTPMFDSQIAAMVCGYGDSISYEALVSNIAKGSVDKSSRFTDWSHRPLTEKQLTYALADVTYLRDIYRDLSSRLDQQERGEWIAEEMAILTSPDTYSADPKNAWRRLKNRNNKPRFLAILMALAEWRETEAQQRNVPRNRVMRDDALMAVAASPPKKVGDLNSVRGVPKGFAGGRYAEPLVTAVGKALAIPNSDLPKPEPRKETPRGVGPTMELLRVLLKMRCDEQGVAQKLIANARDLEQIAGDDNADVACLKGWRYDLFGNDALKLKRGELGIGIRDGKAVVISL